MNKPFIICLTTGLPSNSEGTALAKRWHWVESGCKTPKQLIQDLWIIGWSRKDILLLIAAKGLNRPLGHIAQFISSLSRELDEEMERVISKGVVL